MANTVLDRLHEQADELLAKRDRKDFPDLSKYENDFPLFCRRVLKTALWEPHQREVGEAVLSHRHVVVRSANSIGKDFPAARLALFWVYVRRGLVLITGPTQRQVREILFRGEIARASS